MPINREQAMKAVELLAKDKNMQLCVEESIKGAFIAGAGALAGGLIAGPMGMAAGAALGGVTGAKYCKKFKPIYQVLQEMNEEQKQKLYEHVMKVVQQLKIEDGVLLIAHWRQM